MRLSLTLPHLSWAGAFSLQTASVVMIQTIGLLGQMPGASGPEVPSRSPHKGTAWNEPILLTSMETIYKHVKKLDNRTLKPGLNSIDFYNFLASQTKSRDVLSLDISLV